MSGLELIAHLTRRNIKIPTIIMAALHDIESQKRCKSAGVVAMLTKPLQDKSLFSAMDDAISSK